MEIPKSLFSKIRRSKLLKRPEINRKSLILLLAIVAIFSAALVMRVYPVKYGYLHKSSLQRCV